ncbi:hypothetical protein MTO96_018099 [Rhipicephalus appendiculatus]
MERKRAHAKEENEPPKCNDTPEKREKRRPSREKLHFVSPTEGPQSVADSASFFTSDEASSSSAGVKASDAAATTTPTSDGRDSEARGAERRPAWAETDGAPRHTREERAILAQASAPQALLRRGALLLDQPRGDRWRPQDPENRDSAAARYFQARQPPPHLYGRESAWTAASLRRRQPEHASGRWASLITRTGSSGQPEQGKARRREVLGCPFLPGQLKPLEPQCGGQAEGTRALSPSPGPPAATSGADE